MSNTSEASQTIEQPSPNLDSAEPVIAVLDRFSVIDNVLFRSAVVNLPSVLGLLLLADWLIGRGVFVGDLFRLTGILTIAIGLIVVRRLFDKVPEALRTIWTRSLVGSSRDSQPTSEAFASLIHQFKNTLNGRLAWLVGVIFAIAGLIATYPVRYLIATGSSPFDLSGLIHYYFFGNAAVIAVPLGYVIGLLAWRIGVITFFIAQLGNRFELRVQPGHPDRSGGLRPLGDVCLTIAVLLLLPALFLSGWGVATTVSNIPGTEIYAALWSDLFKKWLLVLSVAALFFFFRPLFGIHQQMEKQRRAIQRELDELSQKMSEISLELRTQADRLTPEQGAQRLESLKFIEKVYQESSRVPTWPFDWNIILKFSIAQAVPLLNLTGVSASLIKIVESVISSLPK